MTKELVKWLADGLHLSLTWVRQHAGSWWQIGECPLPIRVTYAILSVTYVSHCWYLGGFEDGQLRILTGRSATVPRRDEILPRRDELLPRRDEIFLRVLPQLLRSCPSLESLLRINACKAEKEEESKCGRICWVFRHSTLSCCNYAESTKIFRRGKVDVSCFQKWNAELDRLGVGVRLLLDGSFFLRLWDAHYDDRRRWRGQKGLCHRASH